MFVLAVPLLLIVSATFCLSSNYHQSSLIEQFPRNSTPLIRTKIGGIFVGNGIVQHHGGGGHHSSGGFSHHNTGGIFNNFNSHNHHPNTDVFGYNQQHHFKPPGINIVDDVLRDVDGASRITLGLGTLLANTIPSQHSSSDVIVPPQIPMNAPTTKPPPPKKSPGQAFKDIQPKCGVRGQAHQALFNNNNAKRVKRVLPPSTTLKMPPNLLLNLSTVDFTNNTLDGKEPTGEAQARIVGGSAIPSSNSESYPPWQASLRFQDAHVCGGSLISTQFVVTAAHCFKETSSDPSVWSVYLGKVRRNLGEPTEIGPLRVVSVAVHPEYGYKFNRRFDADIALLYLAEPVRYNRHAFPICLPQQGHDGAQPGQMCLITGFGDTKGSGDEGYLKEAQVPIIDHERCRNSSKRMAKDLTDSMVCAGYLDEQGQEVVNDACQGDSGGPLTCPNSKGDVFVLNGIISWGYSCGAPNAPGVYTRVSKYVSWIRQTAVALTAAHQAGGGTTPKVADHILAP